MLDIIDSDNLVKLTSLEISNSIQEEKLLYRENDIIVNLITNINNNRIDIYKNNVFILVISLSNLNSASC